MIAYRFIQPLDVLHLRGNRLFGDGGGNSVMPPWPSVFAGAIRSRMLIDEGVDPTRFARGDDMPGALTEILGSPERPGSFTVRSLSLARRTPDAIEPLRPLPADVEVFEDENAGARVVPHRLWPRKLPTGLAASIPLADGALLQRRHRGKPRGGYWLTARGWERYLGGKALGTDDLIHKSEIWQTEQRLGIELDHHRRSTVEGQLYTTEAVRLCNDPETGFLVGVSDGGTLPNQGFLRLGGDGRAATVSAASVGEEIGADFDAIETVKRCRLILTSPGIFPEGWRLPGLDADGIWPLEGLQVRITAAAVPRGGVISGWDLARRCPKPATRVAPTGAVYWLEIQSGDIDRLRKLSETGLWGLSPDNNDPTRRAEGFNRFAIANA